MLALDQDAAGTRAAREMQDALVAIAIPAIRLVWSGAKDCGELLQQGDAGRAQFLDLLPMLPPTPYARANSDTDADDWLHAAYDDQHADAA